MKTQTHSKLSDSESLLKCDVSVFGLSRSADDLLQTEMDAGFLHMASPLSLLFWLITPTRLCTNTTSQLTGCLTDGGRVDSIRAGQLGESLLKVAEQHGRAVWHLSTEQLRKSNSYGICDLDYLEKFPKVKEQPDLVEYVLTQPNFSDNFTIFVFNL